MKLLYIGDSIIYPAIAIIDLRSLRDYVGEDFELPPHPEKNLVFDPRPSIWDHSGPTFDIKIQQSRLIIIRTDQPDEGWRGSIQFRVYDRTKERVPPFDSSEPYIYWGHKREYAPHDTVHVKVHHTAKKITHRAFSTCIKMITCDMRDAPVEEIQEEAFGYCRSIRTIYLSKNLKKIGPLAFFDCRALDILVVPSTVRCIRREAFGCSNVKILKLPDVIHLNNVVDDNMFVGDVLKRAVPDNMSPKQWLKERYDAFPLHKICYYNANVTDDAIQKCLETFPNAANLSDDLGMTALHIMAIATGTFQSQTRLNDTTQGQKVCPAGIAMMTNYPPVATAEGCIVKIFNANTDAALVPDCMGKTPLDYLLDYDLLDIHNFMVASISVHASEEYDKDREASNVDELSSRPNENWRCFSPFSLKKKKELKHN